MNCFNKNIYDLFFNFECDNYNIEDRSISLLVVIQKFFFSVLPGFP